MSGPPQLRQKHILVASSAALLNMVLRVSCQSPEGSPGCQPYGILTKNHVKKQKATPMPVSAQEVGRLMADKGHLTFIVNKSFVRASLPSFVEPSPAFHKGYST